jgi:hypothetical protein
MAASQVDSSITAAENLTRVIKEVTQSKEFKVN